MPETIPTVEDKIIEIVCKELKQPIEGVLSKKRKRELCEARQVAAYAILMTNKRVTYQAVADKLHYESHATAMHSLKVVAGFLETEKDYKSRITPVLYAVYNYSASIKQNKKNEEINHVLDKCFPESEYDFYQNIFYQSQLIIL